MAIGVGIGMIAGYSIGSSNGLTGWELVGSTIGGGIIGGLLGAAGGYAIEAFLLGGSASGLSIGSFYGATISSSYAIAATTAPTLSIATAGVAATSLIYMAYQRKPISPRIKCNSRKEAYNKAFLKGGKKPPILHNGPYGPHYHPANLKFRHWHYYFSLLLSLMNHDESCNCLICQR